MNNQSNTKTRTSVSIEQADFDLLAAVASAEDRTKQAVLHRALELYAAASAEYQASKQED